MYLRIVTGLAVTAALTALPLDAAAAPPASYVYYAANIAPDGIYRTPPAGGSPELVLANGRNPSVSPDGSRLAFERGGHIWVHDLSTQATTQVTIGQVEDDEPDWSPDGTTIAFARHRNDIGDPAIYTVPANGSAPAAPVGGGATAGHPTWSPSGRQLAVRAVGPSGRGIEILTLGSETRAAVPGTVGALWPEWSPDGTRLAFTIRNPNNHGVRVVPVRGGTPTVLTDLPGYDWPTWSDDSTAVYVTYETSGFVSEIRRLTVDGLGDTLIASATDRYLFQPSFSGPTPPADVTPPAAPGSVTAALAATQVTLSWTGAADVSEFVVRRSTAGGPAPAAPTDGLAVYDGSGTTTTAGGLTNGAAYRFSVFAMDAWGNVSAPASRGARPTGVPALITPRFVSDIVTTPRWSVHWRSPFDQPEPLGGYDVRRGVRTRTPSGWSAVTWQTVHNGTPNRSVQTTGVRGETVYFAVRARDDFGNGTVFASGWTGIPVDDAYYAMRWSAGWTHGPASVRWASTLSTTSTAGRSVSFTAETQGFAVIGDRCPGCGVFRVYVDGTLRATVDSRASSVQARQVLWFAPFGGGIGSRTIRIEALGTPGRAQVRLDAVGLFR